MTQQHTTTAQRPTPAMFARAVPAHRADPATILEPPTSGIQELAITPDTAALWLDKYNSHNRKPKPIKYEQYARDMTTGRWREPGESMICVANTPTGQVLINGQNRLKAVVVSGATIRFVFRGGYRLEDQDTMDTGAGRTAADTLTLYGESNANLLAAIIARVIRREAGVQIVGGNSLAPTRSEVVSYLEAHPELRRAADVARMSSTAKLPVSHAAIGTCYHLCAEQHLRHAETFYVEHLIGGLGLTEGNPALVLRNRFTTESVAGRNMLPDEVLPYTIHAWNLWRDGRKVTKLQSPKGGWTAENFPEPK